MAFKNLIDRGIASILYALEFWRLLLCPSLSKALIKGSLPLFIKGSCELA
jgi:hypothetical protein